MERKTPVGADEGAKEETARAAMIDGAPTEISNRRREPQDGPLCRPKTRRECRLGELGETTD